MRRFVHGRRRVPRLGDVEVGKELLIQLTTALDVQWLELVLGHITQNVGSSSQAKHGGYRAQDRKNAYTKVFKSGQLMDRAFVKLLIRERQEMSVRFFRGVYTRYRVGRRQDRFVRLFECLGVFTPRRGDGWNASDTQFASHNAGERILHGRRDVTDLNTAGIGLGSGAHRRKHLDVVPCTVLDQIHLGVEIVNRVYDVRGRTC